MPTVTALKGMFQNQIAPNDDSEFLRLLTEADMRLLEFGRWGWTRTKATITPVDGIITLPTTYASILGARVGKGPVDVFDQDYEFCPGGPGEIDLGHGHSKLIDQGMNDVVVTPAGDPELTISGSLTDGSNPVVFPTLIPTSIAGCFSSDGEDSNPATGTWYEYIRAISDTCALRKFVNGVVTAEWEGIWAESPEDTTGWAPLSVGATGTPTFALTEGDPEVVESRRQYKVTGYLADDDVVTALLHYAPVTLMDPDIADSMVPDDATVNTRCPDSTALKLMMLGILMEEAHDHGGARSFISDALKGLDNKEQAQRGGAQRTIQARPMGRNVRRIRGWR